MTSNPDFKVTPLVDTEYPRNSTRYTYLQRNTNRDLHTPYSRMSLRMTLSDLAKYSVTRIITRSVTLFLVYNDWLSEVQCQCRSRVSQSSQADVNNVPYRTVLTASVSTEVTRNDVHVTGSVSCHGNRKPRSSSSSANTASSRCSSRDVWTHTTAMISLFKCCKNSSSLVDGQWQYMQYFSKQEVNVIWLKAPHGGPFPR